MSVSDDEAGVAVVTMESDANGAHFAIAEKTLKLTPTVSEGTVTWVCTVSSMNLKYVPLSCK